MTKPITPAQAHMLAMTRLLGKLTHETAGANGLVTARALAARGLVTMSPKRPRKGQWWEICIPFAQLLVELGVSRVGDRFLKIGARYYGIRTWHDGRQYIRGNHPGTGDNEMAFLDELFPEGEA